MEDASPEPTAGEGGVPGLRLEGPVPYGPLRGRVEDDEVGGATRRDRPSLVIQAEDPGRTERQALDRRWQLDQSRTDQLGEHHRQGRFEPDRRRWRLVELLLLLLGS